MGFQSHLLDGEDHSHRMGTQEKAAIGRSASSVTHHAE
jgi:hypothetical protein